MSEPVSIPVDLHTEMRPALTDALGDFWASVFSDSAFVEGTVTARVLSACQLQLDALEALSLRDHRTSPTFHREHWHPVVIRRSGRNKGRGLTIGMDDTPLIGAQTTNDGDYAPGQAVYSVGEVFEVGGNAAYSKVYTYPFTSFAGCSLISVRTCLCDAIRNPSHLLLPDRDFSVSDGVLVIRKEQDPFDTGGYRIVADGDDQLAVLWACDALFDTENVSDFVGYPLGVTTPSSEAASRILSAIWEVVTYGISPGRLNAVLGAVFDVPTVPADTVVERITTVDGVSTVVTADAVYRVPESRLSDAVTVGATLAAGTLLTNDLAVYHSLSPTELRGLATPQVVGGVTQAPVLGRLSLPPGSLAGVTETVVLESRDCPQETNPEQGWFKLNAGDTFDSPFWTAVRSRTTLAERKSLFAALADGGSTVNPLVALGYLALANAVLVTTTRPLRDDPCAGLALTALHRLMPASSSLIVIQTIDVGDSYDVGALSDAVVGTREGTVAGGTVTESGGVVTVSGGTVSAETSLTEAVPVAGDDVSVVFLPLAATEV